MQQPHDRASKWQVGVMGAVMVLASFAVLAAPTVSVPSTPDISGKVHVQGKELPAYAHVTVRFENAQMAPIDMVTQADADGSFSVKFTPLINGAYQVKVFDGRRRQLGGGSFGYYR